MFHARLRPHLELRLLEERHAAEVFALVNRERAELREWLPWVDATHDEDDTHDGNTEEIPLPPNSKGKKR